MTAARSVLATLPALVAVGAAGTRLNETRIAHYVAESVMLVTALSPVIGYEKSAQIAQKAMKDGGTLKEAALASGDVDEATYDKVMDPMGMVGHGTAGA